MADLPANRTRPRGGALAEQRALLELSEHERQILIASAQSLQGVHKSPALRC